MSHRMLAHAHWTKAHQLVEFLHQRVRTLRLALGQPAERAFNGIIANDKFCMTRYGQLRLSWSRHAVYLQGKIRRESGYPADEHAHSGGTDETPVAHPSYDSHAGERPAALGSSLSEPSAMEVFIGAPSGQTGPASTPQPGGVSCE